VNYRDEINKILNDKNGTLLTSDLKNHNIPRLYLTLMVRDKLIERVERGVYVSTSHIQDEMYAYQKKYPQIIYSHETALFLYGLTDRTPFEYSVTVPSGYKSTPKFKEQFKIYYIKEELHDKDINVISTSFGNSISVYTLERTIVDLLRSKNRIDIQIFLDGIRRALVMKKIDNRLLMKCAKEHHVDRKLREYMEILND
jgi:hypothetical protein